MMRLVHVSFDVLLLAVLVALANRFLFRSSPRTRSLLWLLVPAKAITAVVVGAPWVLWSPAGIPGSLDTARAPRVVQFSAQEFAPRAARTASEATPPATAPNSPSTNSTAPAAPTIPTAARASATPASSAFSWRRTLSVLWGAGVVVLVLRSVLDRIRAARLIRAATPADPRTLRVAAQVAAELGVKPTAVLRTRALASPALVGVLRPVTLLPEWMEDPAQIEWAIRHELMHVALRDPWAGLVREIGRIVLFFHPAVWWAGRKWEEDVELACDRALVRDQGESLDYAHRLHQLAGRICRHDAPLAHGLFAVRSRVGRRIERLVEEPRGRARLTPTGVLALGLLASATLAVGAGDGIGAPEKKDFVLPGRVLGPDGAPRAGADVVAATYDRTNSRFSIVARTTSDDDGRFTLAYDEGDLPYDSYDAEPWQKVSISAHLSGFGPAWVEQRNVAAGSGVSLPLIADHAVEATLIDEDGEPLRGATVRLVGLSTSEDGSLDEWQAALEKGTNLFEAYRFASHDLSFAEELAPVAVTDERGRFRLVGIGADRLCWLRFFGGEAAYGHARVCSRPLDAALLAQVNDGCPEPVHSTGSRVVASRCRPVEGVVRDAATSAPLAGVQVVGYAIADRGMPMLDEALTLRTTTDAKGHYRLLGMPKADGNVILAIPADDQPYFLRQMRVPNPAGSKPVTVDVPLDRGIWIEGKVTLRDSTQVVPGCVVYYPHLFDALTRRTATFQDLQVDGPRGHYRVAADGSYRIVGLPGRGLVGVEGFGRFQPGVGFDEGWDRDQFGELALAEDGSFPSVGPSWPHTMALLEVPKDAVSFHQDLELLPARTSTVEVVDADGVPVPGCHVSETGPAIHRERDVDAASFEIDATGPSSERIVSVVHEGRAIGRVFRPNAEDTEPLRVTLLPTHQMRGRLVDQDGVPLAGVQTMLYHLPEEQPTRGQILTDAKGEFSLGGILAGGSYRLYVVAEQFLVPAISSFSVEGDEDLDFGTLRVELPER